MFCSSAHPIWTPGLFHFFFFFQSAFLILPEVSRLTCAAHMQPMHICPTQSNRGGQASAQGHSVAQGRTFKNSRVCLCALQTHHMIKSASPRSFTLRRGSASVSSQPGFARARKLRGWGGKQNMRKCMRLFAGKTLSSVHCVVSASDSEVSARSKYMFLSHWTSEHLFQRVKPREEKFGSSKRRLFV